MTDVRMLQKGELIALRPGQARAEPGAGIARAQSLSPADPHNIVPFTRPRAAEAHAPVALPSDAPRPSGRGLWRERLRLLAFASLSLAVHGALFAAFWRDPVPLASIGLEVMSVEIMVGATAPAGAAPVPGEQDVQAAAVANDQTIEPEQKPAQQATEQPQTVPVARAETAPEASPELPAEPKPSIAMVETPQPDTATAAPREIPPDMTELSLLPQPQETPAEPRTERKPAQARSTKPVNAAPATERRRIAAPTKDHAAKPSPASTPSTAANNVGIGRSDHDSNYAGRVSAHLRHHQQYPADARSRGEQGTAAVIFGLDGGGRVTSVRLARASGISSIDQEVQAMVRRASPFPAPPSGRGVSFTVPVNFRLN